MITVFQVKIFVQLDELNVDFTTTDRVDDNIERWISLN
jgi:hypothetical protein